MSHRLKTAQRLLALLSSLLSSPKQDLSEVFCANTGVFLSGDQTATGVELSHFLRVEPGVVKGTETNKARGSNEGQEKGRGDCRSEPQRHKKVNMKELDRT